MFSWFRKLVVCIPYWHLDQIFPRSLLLFSSPFLESQVSPEDIKGTNKGVILTGSKAFASRFPRFSPPRHHPIQVTVSDLTVQYVSLSMDIYMYMYWSLPSLQWLANIKAFTQFHVHYTTSCFSKPNPNDGKGKEGEEPSNTLDSCCYAFINSSEMRQIKIQY